MNKRHQTWRVMNKNQGESNKPITLGFQKNTPQAVVFHRMYKTIRSNTRAHMRVRKQQEDKLYA